MKMNGTDVQHPNVVAPSRPASAGERSSTSGAWLIRYSLPCLACEYDLIGLHGPVVRCPECGADHDLGNLQDWLRRRHAAAGSPSFRLLLQPFAVSVATAMLFVGGLFVAGRASPIWLLLPAMIAACGGLLWLHRAQRFLLACSKRGLGFAGLMVFHIGGLGLVAAAVLVWMAGSNRAIGTPRVQALTLMLAATISTAVPLMVIGCLLAARALRRAGGGEASPQFADPTRRNT